MQVFRYPGTSPNALQSLAAKFYMVQTLLIIVGNFHPDRTNIRIGCLVVCMILYLSGSVPVKIKVNSLYIYCFLPWKTFFQLWYSIWSSPHHLTHLFVFCGFYLYKVLWDFKSMKFAPCLHFNWLIEIKILYETCLDIISYLFGYVFMHMCEF